MAIEDEIKVEYEIDPAEHLIIEYEKYKGTEGRFKGLIHIETRRLTNLNDVIPEKMLPTVAYMVCGIETKHRKDFWCFDYKNRCINHNYRIIKDERTVERIKKPDKDIGLLVQENKLIYAAFEKLLHEEKYSVYVTVNPLCKILLDCNRR